MNTSFTGNELAKLNDFFLSHPFKRMHVYTIYFEYQVYQISLYSVVFFYKSTLAKLQSTCLIPYKKLKIQFSFNSITPYLETLKLIIRKQWWNTSR